MNINTRKFIASLFLMFLAQSILAFDVEMRGLAGIESRIFFDDPQFTGQKKDSFSYLLNPELYFSFDDSPDSVTISLFTRFDNADNERKNTDNERTHSDIRELSYLKVSDYWELKLGISKVFWGVTEGQHLVDVINQTDLVDNLDGEDKLGQPMINLTWLKHLDYGVFDFFILPGFRERTFPGPESRLRPNPTVDTNNVEYEASNRRSHTDAAFRWSHSIGVFDLGLSYFNGTSRDPILEPVFTSPGPPTNFRPYYPIINQTGFDAQASLDGWLLKLEVISRSGAIRQSVNAMTGEVSYNRERYTALTTGFEYTIVGILSSNVDLGLIAEWNYDDRQSQDSPQTTFQDDALIGTRWAFNDASSSEILLGVLQDLEYETTSFTLEANTRVSDNVKLTVESRVFAEVDEKDILILQLEEDSFIQVQLDYYF